MIDSIRDSSGRFLKGSSGFNRKHTKETKEKISKMQIGRKMTEKQRLALEYGRRSRKGIKMSEEVKNKISISRMGRFRGKDHPRWTGKTSEDKLERARSVLQMKVFIRDDFTCQDCGERGKFLQVNHKKSWSKYPELRFDIDNCETLCMRCHYMRTFNREMPQDIKIWGHNFISYINSRGGELL